MLCDVISAIASLKYFWTLVAAEHFCDVALLYKKGAWHHKKTKSEEPSPKIKCEEPSLLLLWRKSNKLRLGGVLLDLLKEVFS